MSKFDMTLGAVVGLGVLAFAFVWLAAPRPSRKPPAPTLDSEKRDA